MPHAQSAVAVCSALTVGGLFWCVQYFARTVPAISQLIKAFRVVCERNRWAQIAILVSETWAPDADAFQTELLQFGIEVRVRVRVADSGFARAALEQIERKQLRVVMLMQSSNTQLRRWLLDAYDLGMTSKGWAYFTADVRSVESIAASEGDGRDDDVLAAMQGLIIMVPQPQLSAKFQSLVQRAAVQDARERAGKAVPSHMWASPHSVYLGFMYDALYTLVVAADAEISAGGSASNGTALMARLLGGAPVDGMTGQVSFDTNGDSMVLWEGLNVQNRTMVPVISYTPSLKKLATVAESSMLRPIVWPGNTMEAPVDYFSGELRLIDIRHCSVWQTSRQADGRTHARVDRRTDGQTDIRRTDRPMDGLKDARMYTDNGRTHRRTHEWMDQQRLCGRADGRTDACMHAWAGGRTDGRMDGRTDGRTEERAGGRTER